MIAVITEWNPLKSLLNLRKRPGETASERMLRISKGSSGVPIKALNDKGDLLNSARKVVKTAQEG